MNQYIMIDNESFWLDDVKLRYYFGPEPRIDLFADCHDLQMAGIAINCISLINSINKVEDVQDKLIVVGNQDQVASFDINIANKENEIGESVICKPGQVLEINKLRITLGKINDGFINIILEGMCESLEGFIEVKSELSARIFDETR